MMIREWRIDVMIVYNLLISLDLNIQTIEYHHNRRMEWYLVLWWIQSVNE